MMNVHTTRRFCVFLAEAALVAGASAQITVTEPVPSRVTVQVDATRPAAYRIPRTIYGSFLEPIGNSTYNGLWAEILQNPSLEENLWNAGGVAQMIRAEPALQSASNLGLPLPWEPLDGRQGNRYEPHWGDAANSSRYLMIIGLPDQPTGIKQKVFLPVHRTLAYRGSLYARHISGSAQLTVSIRQRNSTTVLASAQVDASATTWMKYSYALQIPANSIGRLEPADFVVEVTGDERVDVDQLSLMPQDAIDGLDPEMVAMAKAMKTPLVRFGGNFTSGYHWKDGVGPLDKRVSMLNIAWGMPELNTFGTDEFLRFCQLIGAQPQIALNLGSGTPAEAAAWVKYVNEHWENKDGGLTWELGNELWGNWNLGSPTLGELPARTRAYSEATRAVDPKARLIATGQDVDGYQQWNAAQLTNPAKTFDYLSTHFVVTSDQVRMPNATPDFIASATFAEPVELGRKLRAMQEQINHYPAFANTAHLAFTEWLFAGNPRHTPNYVNMGGAVATAGFFNMLMRNADVVPISDMTGIIEFGGIWKKRSQVYGVPAYYAFRMYSNADATRPVAVETHGGVYAVHQGVTRVPEITDVPYLDIVAALNDSGDTLTLFCVNRHLDRDLTASIDLKGFSARPIAEVQVLNSDSIYDTNDEMDPENIVPVPGTAHVTAGKVNYTFAHESVSVLTLHKR